MNPESQDICRYARGYLERDLAPESLWSKATSDVNSASSAGPFASSSSSIEATAPPAYDPNHFGVAAELRELDIRSYAAAFLANPGGLLTTLPPARVFSKFRSIEHIPLIPSPNKCAKSKRGSATAEDVEEDV